MTKDQVKVEVQKAQTVVDSIVPGKVEVSAEYCSESRCYYIKGEYMNYINIGGKTAPVASWKTEKMDRYYCVTLFASFFKQRAAYMNASAYWKAIAKENNVHPAMFKEWRNEFKRTSSDMISYLDKDPELVK
jgi:hypothetical protein